MDLYIMYRVGHCKADTDVKLAGLVYTHWKTDRQAASLI